MAFKLEKIMSGANFEKYEVYPTTASETYVLGEVLTLTNGKLTKAGVDTDGTQKFICGTGYVAPSSGNVGIPVYRITPSMIFRVPSQANNSSTAIGSVVTLHTDAGQVTATATKGCCEVVDLLGGGTAGTEILVRFPATAGR